jgi:hypothetical protein
LVFRMSAENYSARIQNESRIGHHIFTLYLVELTKLSFCTSSFLFPSTFQNKICFNFTFINGEEKEWYELKKKKKFYFSFLNKKSLYKLLIKNQLIFFFFLLKKKKKKNFHKIIN